MEDNVLVWLVARRFFAPCKGRKMRALERENGSKQGARTWAPGERDKVRSTRTGRGYSARARTVNMNRSGKRELAAGRLLRPDVEGIERPRTRGDCVGGERPCPFVSCSYNLYLDVHPRNGSIKLNFPDLEPDEMAESCCLDVADRGGETLDAVGQALNIVRERVRQIENGASTKLRRRLAMWREDFRGAA